MIATCRHTAWTILIPGSLVALALTGCGTGFAPDKSVAPVSVASAPAQGIVMGGQQPVAGVTLQLYAAGTSGYGLAATPLLPAGAVKTTSNGNFTLPSLNCPTPGALTYLVGTGGQPIAATQTTAAVTNNNLAMMVGLGACSSVGSQFINVNEITTVATVYALSPFMTGIGNVGTSPSNVVGLTNAFAAINKIVNTTNGVVSGPALPANATLPITEINTLADILEQCVNSGGGTASDTTDGQTNGTGCGKLFYLTGGVSTTDTITAALNIAQHPGTNVAKLNQLRSSSPVFTPVISVNTPPTDFTIAITYSGGGLNAPQGVATDQNGNIWVANPGNSSVSEFSPAGAALSPTAGFTAGAISTPYALAIDQSGSVWVANSGNNTITKLASTGASGTVYSGNGLSVPKSIAIDAAGNAFVANSTGTTGISGFSNSGTALSGSPFSGGGVSTPTAIAISPK